MRDPWDLFNVIKVDSPATTNIQEITQTRDDMNGNTNTDSNISEQRDRLLLSRPREQRVVQLFCRHYERLGEWQKEDRKTRIEIVMKRCTGIVNVLKGGSWASSSSIHFSRRVTLSSSKMTLFRRSWLDIDHVGGKASRYSDLEVVGVAIAAPRSKSLDWTYVVKLRNKKIPQSTCRLIRSFFLQNSRERGQ